MKNKNTNPNKKMSDSEFKAMLESPTMKAYHGMRQSGLDHRQAMSALEVKPANIINFIDAAARLKALKGVL